MRRLMILLACAIAAALGGGSASAQEPGDGPVVVADVRGPLEQRALDFLTAVVQADRSYIPRS